MAGQIGQLSRMQLSPAHKEALAAAEQGRYAEAETLLREVLADAPQDGPAQRAVARLRLLQAKVEAPADPHEAVKLAQLLSSMIGAPAARGADEGARIDCAAELVLQIGPAIADADKPIAANILWRAGRYEAAARLGGPVELAALAVEAGAPHALLHQLAKIESDADRLAMMSQHRAWAQKLEAAATPLRRPPATARDRLRVGFLSSDLRLHVVAYFVQPLFEFTDPRFELFIYSSFQGPADQVQTWFEGQAAGVRRLPADAAEAAQVIADDELDLLIDLAGPTSNGRPEVLAYKPARRQATWLGYPHSLGFAGTDFYVADPFLAPERADLLFEAPLLMPMSWICMSPAAFGATPEVAQPGPAARLGHVTFGTANDVYKWTPKVLRTWAQVLAATPGSRFVFIRPEVGSQSLRDSVTGYFAEAGVSADRLEFRALRGGVRMAYADIDIALDTFPVTGGTTTCEAVWMGTPTVTMVGPAVYERVSYSILTNLGLGDLCAETVEDYVRIAVDLANAPERIADLRSSLRSRVQVGALGQPRRFAADFYEMLAGALSGWD